LLLFVVLVKKKKNGKKYLYNFYIKKEKKKKALIKYNIKNNFNLVLLIINKNIFNKFKSYVDTICNKIMLLKLLKLRQI